MKKIKNILLIIFLLTVIFLPPVLFAQSVTGGSCGSGMSNVADFLCRLTYLLNKVIPIVVALGVVYFIWGIVTYVVADEEEARKTGRDRIVYGLIGLAVISTIWGLVNILVKTFNIPIVKVNGPSICQNGAVLKASPHLADLMNYITCLISGSVIPLIFSLAVVLFVYGVVQYVINNEDEIKKERGRSFMIWGVIALTVMITIWGLVSIVGSTFNMNTTVVPQLQQ